MAKYYGQVGYAVTTETSPGIWEESIIEKNYYGDLIRNNRRLSNGEGTNDNIEISNTISILADPFAKQNIYAMRYATFQGTKWKVASVDVDYPRLNLSLGGIYNENTN